ncbi:MAG: hypothetical protein M1834_005260 [Cirrosporium novae-zelandiae]|nr:MAG: hypothetical protein M1834_005260 [Cirrosporium novae-zelandiae]
MTSTPQQAAHPAHQLLARAHPLSRATEIFTDRIQHRKLLLGASSPPPPDNRAKRRRLRALKKAHYKAHRTPAPLSAHEKRTLGLHDLSREKLWTSTDKEDIIQREEVLRKLRGLWVGYMQEILELDLASLETFVSAQAHGSKLASADFHGAELTVVRSRCVGRVGIKGTVVRDGKFAFVIVGNEITTGKGRVWTIPKEHTVFRFEVPLPNSESSSDSTLNEHCDPHMIHHKKLKSFIFELHGEQFKNRPPDRANKKFKWRNMPYL